MAITTINKPITMNKYEKLRKQVAKELTKNPAQQRYIKDILKLYFNCTYDLEDVANLYAALYKVANWIKDNPEEYPSEVFTERLADVLND